MNNKKKFNWHKFIGILFMLIAVIHPILGTIYILKTDKLTFTPYLASFIELIISVISYMTDKENYQVVININEISPHTKIIIRLIIIIIVIIFATVTIKYTKIYLQNQKLRDKYGNYPVEQKIYYGTNGNYYSIGSYIDPIVKTTPVNNEPNNIELKIYTESSIIKNMFICINNQICISEQLYLNENDKAISTREAMDVLKNKIFKPEECKGTERLICENDQYQLTYNDDSIIVTNFKRTCVLGEEKSFCE